MGVTREKRSAESGDAKRAKASRMNMRGEDPRRKAKQAKTNEAEMGIALTWGRFLVFFFAFDRGL